jgi:hypothetical protein
MESGAYGATMNHHFELSPTNFETVQMAAERNLEAFERWYWESFSSEQL